MSKWILICPKCKTEFEHSQISDVGMSFLMIQRSLNLQALATVYA